MSDPYRNLVSSLERRFSGIVSQAVSGVGAELGTITGGGLKLDSFKHEIPDYGVAEWTAKLHLPNFSMVGTMTSPVREDGTALAGASTSVPTRFDFAQAEVEGVKVEFRSGFVPGDRVLAISVNDGNHAVVVCKVVSADG
ncbi:hypothetical protein [Cohnella fermenti]|uniref:Uncharacterized protein n=1 Tax=Cohnella fermenti TaxID=2565925 RepID=A0A4S4BY12_9BACL|nr:hypothetical protein [Cohnella fermenti]THF78022.1 hypothetical protein E6C55_15090 [Cohnella fermenti]